MWDDRTLSGIDRVTSHYFCRAIFWDFGCTFPVSHFNGYIQLFVILALHWVMFQPNIVSLCDEEQQARWLPLCRDWRMIGCYAQTELGHGSNIRALETTATFLPESKGGQKGGSWVINSPTLTSGKFWPGTLGRTANVSIHQYIYHSSLCLF